MKRLCLRSFGLLGLSLLIASPASAQVVQSLHVGFGLFSPRGFTSRTPGDVLVEDLTRPEVLPGVTDSYLFSISDFKNAHVFGEWQVAFGNHLELAGGVGYYARTVPSIYRDLTNFDGREIEQDLKLRIVPITGVVRFMPIGRPGTVQPYAGAGIGALNYRYTEVGDFVDSNLDVFPERYITTGTAVGPLFLLGVRLPVKGDIYGVTLEYRYQFGEGDTGGIANGFLGDKIDLSGYNLNFGFLVRF